MTPNITFDPHALQDRVAVITGAGGGLGGAMVARLVGMGATVVAADMKAPDNAQAALSLACDITDEAAIEAMAAAVKARFGRCDILVNNAGIMAPVVPLEELPVATWDKVMAVNLRGSFLCAKHLVRLMLAQKSGAIVNLASIGARVPNDIGAYGPSKAGVLGLTHQMAVEWGPRGVRTNSVSPGMIRTPLSEVHYRDEAKLHHRVSRIPARRIGRPEDIGDAVAFLATEASSYINGQDLVVDGGFLKASLANLY